MSVAGREELSSRSLRLTFEGPGLSEMPVANPAASVRLLVPQPGASLVIPEWDGNEFLLPDGSRPALRTFTPLRHDAGAGRMDLEIVRHAGGAVSTWAETAEPGTSGALSGPGRGFVLGAEVRRFVLLGDETALPAISQLIETTPHDVAIEAHIEIVAADVERPLPEHPSAEVMWHVRGDDQRPAWSLVDVAAFVGVEAGTHVWAAGEAAAMQAIRKHLFDERGLQRSQTTIRGYWKPRRD